jgi:hypothetical protein
VRPPGSIIDRADGLARHPFQWLIEIGGMLGPLVPTVKKKIEQKNIRNLLVWSGPDAQANHCQRRSASDDCQVDAPFGVSWGPSDDIVVGQGTKGIMRVSANGGKPEPSSL